MRLISISVILIAGALCLSCFQVATGQTNNEEAENRQILVWFDDFETGTAPDPARWGYDLGNACDLPAGCGWGNNELQYYTDKPENVRIKDGVLIIEAHKERIGENDYTSARLVTKDKGDWKYGKIEIRAKLPTGIGTWPAIWMLPTEWKYGGWPESGEIDIMEHVGYVPDTIYGTVHTEAFNHMLGTQKGGMTYQPDSESDFHTYSIIWSESSIKWYVDGEKYHQFEKEGDSSANWPFDQEFHLLLNLAVGGNWGGAKGIDESIWPQRMEVDYIKVYQ